MMTKQPPNTHCRECNLEFNENVNALVFLFASSRIRLFNNIWYKKNLLVQIGTKPKIESYFATNCIQSTITQTFYCFHIKLN